MSFSSSISYNATEYKYTLNNPVDILGDNYDIHLLNTNRYYCIDTESDDESSYRYNAKKTVCDKVAYLTY
jgi:hypothetical protein